MKNEIDTITDEICKEIARRAEERDELIKLIAGLYAICESEFPEDQWDEYYKPVRKAQEILRELRAI